METGYLIGLFIVVLLCPVAMFFMMRGHGSKEGTRRPGPGEDAKAAKESGVSSVEQHRR